MISIGPRQFRHATAIDFEFIAWSGSNPEPVCMVIMDLETGEVRRYWRDELFRLSGPPFPIDEECVVIAFYASAELSCFEVLGWPKPKKVLDLFAEFRVHTNGKPLAPGGNSLLGALSYFGLDAMAATEKEAMRELILRGGHSEREKHDILDYCAEDVYALQRLLSKMGPTIDTDRAFLRGRYMCAVAAMESVGVPIDVKSRSLLGERWEAIQVKLIEEIDRGFGFYDGRSFRRDRFVKFLRDNNMAWPHDPSGRPLMDRDTWRDMAMVYPRLARHNYLRAVLAKMKLNALAVGPDGRNRTMLSAFQSVTGRNQPSSSESIFGTSSWLRGLIQPQEGMALAYIDYSQQEVGIAAALSGDQKLQAAYLSDDPYLAFAKQAGAVPPDATKKSHREIRDQFKQCVLAVQYGMGPESLAVRINQPVICARDLLKMHQQTYRTYWAWSSRVTEVARLYCSLSASFGWRIHVIDKTKERTLQNFPMQANGAEMLRIACCFVTEAGIRLCAPVHDAILVEAPEAEIEATVRSAQELMADASAEVLAGFRLRSEAKIIKHPDRFMDERGIEMWKTVWKLIEGRE